jgi:hypothetical protein
MVALVTNPKIQKTFARPHNQARGRQPTCVARGRNHKNHSNTPDKVTSSVFPCLFSATQGSTESSVNPRKPSYLVDLAAKLC